MPHAHTYTYDKHMHVQSTHTCVYINTCVCVRVCDERKVKNLLAKCQANRSQREANSRVSYIRAWQAINKGQHSPTHTHTHNYITRNYTHTYTHSHCAQTVFGMPQGFCEFSMRILCAICGS